MKLEITEIQKDGSLYTLMDGVVRNFDTIPNLGDTIRVPRRNGKYRVVERHFEYIGVMGSLAYIEIFVKEVKKNGNKNKSN
jgi:hypothetical protein